VKFVGVLLGVNTLGLTVQLASGALIEQPKFTS
jgi:hypothetical protein